MAKDFPPLSLGCRVITDRRPLLARRFSRLSAALLVIPALLAVAGQVARLFETYLSWIVPDVVIALLLLVWLLGTPLSLLLSLWAGAVLPARSGRLDVSQGGVRFARGSDLRQVPAYDVLAGMALTTATGPAVELHLRDGRVVRAGVEEERDALAVLDRLGLGPERRRVAVMLGSGSRQLMAGVAGFFGAIFAILLAMVALQDHGTPARDLAAALVVLVTTFLARWLTAPAEIVVGAEGVIVRRAGGARMVPFADIEQVSNEGGDILLHLVDHAPPGPRRRAPRIVARGNDAALATGLVDRIREAMAAAGGGAVAVAARLDPEGRPLDEWRAALAGVLQAGRGYRGTGISADDLLAVVEDGAAPAPRRIGAALALRGSEHPEARARVRVAADACADDDVRAALEAAADEEVDEAPIRRVISSGSSRA